MRTGAAVSYYPVLDIPEGRIGRFSVEHDVRAAGAPVPLGTMRTALFGQGAHEPLRYPHETRWHRLVERRQGVWMTDLPVEQRQCDDLIAGLRGTVLVGGLGLGYAATALARRRAVKHIVVVERSLPVVQLAWPHLGDVVHGKAVCVVADLFEYLRAHAAGRVAALTETTGPGLQQRPHRQRTFRAAFYDIWQGDGERTFHDTVVPLLQLSDPHWQVRCWNEDVMRGQLLLGLFARIGVLPAAPDVLDAWCAGDGTVYTRWSLPYWQWYRRTQPTPEHARMAAREYVRCYGRPALARWHDVFPEREAVLS